jgi:hypothetical protein
MENCQRIFDTSAVIWRRDIEFERVMLINMYGFCLPFLKIHWVGSINKTLTMMRWGEKREYLWWPHNNCLTVDEMIFDIFPHLSLAQILSRLFLINFHFCRYFINWNKFFWINFVNVKSCEKVLTEMRWGLESITQSYHLIMIII